MAAPNGETPSECYWYNSAGLKARPTAFSDSDCSAVVLSRHPHPHRCAKKKRSSRSVADILTKCHASTKMTAHESSLYRTFTVNHNINVYFLTGDNIEKATGQCFLAKSMLCSQSLGLFGPKKGPGIAAMETISKQ